MNGEWVKRVKWKVSHFVLTDQRTMWMGDVTARAACGKFVSVNDGLMPKPTSIDTADRCSKCEVRSGA